jgi:hypothetical protein
MAVPDGDYGHLLISRLPAAPVAIHDFSRAVFIVLATLLRYPVYHTPLRWAGVSDISGRPYNEGIDSRSIGCIGKRIRGGPVVQKGPFMGGGTKICSTYPKAIHDTGSVCLCGHGHRLTAQTAPRA